MPGYGLDPYGFGPYGDPGSGAPFDVVGAVAVTRRQVQVTFSVAALTVSGFGSVDALNPVHWTVTRLDTGEVLPVGAVRIINASTVELWLLTPLGGFNITHQVMVAGIESAAFGPIEFPVSALFPGVQDSFVAVGPRPQRPRQVDLKATPQVPGDITNSLIVTGGDYATEQGLELLRKCILRRLTTPLGSFFHLPNYGVGIGPKTKFTPADLRRIKAQIELQVLREPEVEAAQASLTLSPSVGSLTVQVLAQTRTGQAVSVTFQQSASKVGF